MLIRRAKPRDKDGILRLLTEVNMVHAELRPDIFRAGGRKYTAEELDAIILDDTRPIFVCDDGEVLGYAFCVMQYLRGDNITGGAIKTLYIDDLCTEEKARGKGIGMAIFEFVKQYAREAGCYNITLNVWEGNASARRFYENSGLRVQKTGMELIL